jgi:hypothetical protein
VNQSILEQIGACSHVTSSIWQSPLERELRAPFLRAKHLPNKGQLPASQESLKKASNIFVRRSQNQFFAKRNIVLLFQNKEHLSPAV